MVERISSGSPWEESIGYSRAIVAGPWVLVAGCSATVDGVVQHEGDPYEQAIRAFGIAEAALVRAGCTLADVVRTRMYIVHNRDAEAVGRAHRALFEQIRPAATLVEVAGLIDSRMLVEVEVEAYRETPA